jgi:hypothetical protein
LDSFATRRGCGRQLHLANSTRAPTGSQDPVFQGEQHGLSLIGCDDLAVPRVPEDTSAAGVAIAAKPLLMAASIDHQFRMSISLRITVGTVLRPILQRRLPERSEILSGCSSSRRSRTSCCEPQRRLSVRPNVGIELPAAAWRLARGVHDGQRRRAGQVPCRSGSARMTG